MRRFAVSEIGSDFWMDACLRDPWRQTPND
jgi:hypothetical protein